MTDSKAKSNAISREIVQAWHDEDVARCKECCSPFSHEPLYAGIESALATSQSQLAKEALETVRAFCVGNKAEQGEITRRLRALFTRLNIKVG